MESPPRPPGRLKAPWLLGLLLSPWTLRLAGRALLLLPRWLAPHQRSFHPPARPAAPLIPVSGDPLLRLNIADFTGEALGTGGCLANASPRWLLKGRGRHSPLAAV